MPSIQSARGGISSCRGTRDFINWRPLRAGPLVSLGLDLYIQSFFFKETLFISKRQRGHIRQFDKVEFEILFSRFSSAPAPDAKDAAMIAAAHLFISVPGCLKRTSSGKKLEKKGVCKPNGFAFDLKDAFVRVWLAVEPEFSVLRRWSVCFV